MRLCGVPFAHSAVKADRLQSPDGRLPMLVLMDLPPQQSGGKITRKNASKFPIQGDEERVSIVTGAEAALDALKERVRLAFSIRNFHYEISLLIEILI